MRPGPYAEDRSVRSSPRILRVARQLAATIGTESFRAMVTHLAGALQADCVWIGEFVPGPVQRVVTLAAFLEGELGSLVFDLPGSACARIAETGKPCLCRENAQERFPGDQMLRRVNAQACVGIALTDALHVPIGVIMATYRTPVPSLRRAKSILEIFAPRASSELQHKQQEDQLRRSEQRYRAFISQNLDGLWRIEFEHPIPTDLPAETQIGLMRQHGYFAECNDAMARLLGMERGEQVVGLRLTDPLPGDDPNIHLDARELIHANYRFTTKETSRTGADGRTCYLVRSVVGIVEEGSLQRIWGVTHDITNFKHIQRALDASEQRMVDLLEAMQLLVLISDPSGAIRLCNDHFSTLTGWQASDIEGRNWIDLVIPADERPRVAAEFALAMSSSAPVHYESTLLDARGRGRHIEWDGAGLRDADGSVAAVANVGRDITRERALQSQLLQAQKLESIGKLAGGVAHDFNNLLTVISGYAGLLLDGRSTTDPAYAGLAEVQTAAFKGAQLTQQLLAFSRRRVVHLEALDLNSVLRGDAAMLQRVLGDDIELASSLDPHLAPVRADAGQISQVILNLALNARDAMPHGGKLTVATCNVILRDSSAFPEVPPGEYVQIEVSDTGTGMTDEVRSRLFEPFFTTKEPGQGTGLGLSTVYGIVQQSCGHIVVETAVDRGSTFRLFLPMIPPEPLIPEEKDAAPARPGGTETILLVDDRPDVRILTALMLRELGYTVLEANGPAQALNIVHGKVDLILTDEIMPQMRGTELADTIRASNPNVKVLIMSGYIGSGQSHRFDPGFPFLQKPFTQQELALTVRHILDSPPAPLGRD
jgi:two-component system cell cycle sensor histidine kinase/response regulator CckA